MLQSGTIALQNIASELSLYDRSISAAKVILTGFVVVFGMLFLLILIIKLYSAVVSGAQNAADRRAKKKNELVMERVSEDNGVHIIRRPAYVAVPAADDDDSGDEIPAEVVAVIAAAVAATFPTASKPRIKSIKKSGSGRSAWANAGVFDNTRPF